MAAGPLCPRPHLAASVHRWWLVLGWLLLITPAGRMSLSAWGIRVLLRGLIPGECRRGGEVHLRVRLAERLVDELGATNLSGASCIQLFARALGAPVAKDVDLHSVPPVTGMLDLGQGVSIEPEVDLRGHWIDGAKVHRRSHSRGSGCARRCPQQSPPGADIGECAEIAPGSAVFGAVPAGEPWSGAPAEPSGTARGPWLDQPAANRPIWVGASAASAVLISLLPLASVLIGAAVALPALVDTTSVSDATGTAILWAPLGATVGFLALAAMILVLVRLLSIGLHARAHPVHGRQAWQAWSTLRILDDARTWLFPLY